MNNKKKVIIGCTILILAVILVIIVFIILNRTPKPIDLENQNMEVVDNGGENNKPIDTSGISEMDDSELEKYN